MDRRAISVSMQCAPASTAAVAVQSHRTSPAHRSSPVQKLEAGLYILTQSYTMFTQCVHRRRNTALHQLAELARRSATWCQMVSSPKSSSAANAWIASLRIRRHFVRIVSQNRIPQSLNADVQTSVLHVDRRWILTHKHTKRSPHSPHSSNSSPTARAHHVASGTPTAPHSISAHPTIIPSPSYHHHTAPAKRLPLPLSHVPPSAAHSCLSHATAVPYASSCLAPPAPSSAPCARQPSISSGPSPVPPHHHHSLASLPCRWSGRG